MPKPLLILNAGSSSLKFAVFEDDRSLTRIVWGAVDRIGSGRSTLQWKRCDEQEARQVPISGTDHVAALEEVFARLLNESAPSGFGAVGHRVVHGGAKYHEPRKVDTTMLEELRPIRDFDPEHLPVEIALMEELSAKFPETLQVACFDTAFHHQMPRVAQLLPIPRRFEAKGVRRYGFHGISYEYLLLELERLGGSKAAHGRVIFAHLGNGASMAAVLDGKCMDTSMAFTPAAGLLMSTRSGDIDPGLISFLMKHEHMTVPEFDRMINHESGLFGVSETGSDMRDLIEREKTDLRAKEAVALFATRQRNLLARTLPFWADLIPSFLRVESARIPRLSANEYVKACSSWELRLINPATARTTESSRRTRAVSRSA